MNFADMFGKVSQMQQDMEKAKAHLDEIFVEAEAGGNMVHVKMSASKKVKQITINQELLTSGDKEGLEDLLCTALNKALTLAEERHQQEMGHFTQNILGDMNLPNIPGLNLGNLGL
ncbi:MAG: YbaB/EbfC family nucleoid-associated protein [Bacteroidia bacterium]|nr:YbaB/EbfC family nucleoid-associated protein [Bacteroidia bacterium]